MTTPILFLLRRLLATFFIIFVISFLLTKPVLSETFSSQTLKSVVSILPEWPNPQSRSKEPEATAIAIMPGGYLATNNHVINLATAIKVRLNNGRILPAKIIGRDSLTDLALIKIPLDLPIIPIANQSFLGERVCAIGNQFGLGLSVTCGVISALHRTGTGFNPIEDFIQTDAVVNPGGSGGALINSQGNLVGLISAIFTKSNDANIGVNFASSIKLVMRVIREIKEKGRVIRGSPGFKVRNLSLNELQKYVGVLITSINQKGPAKIAGLKRGDIIIKIDERDIISSSDIPSAIHMVRPGIPLIIDFIRDGKKETTTLFLSR